MRKFLRRSATAAVTGAAIMYFFDPENGRRRRALLRDKTEATFRSTGRDVSRRTRYAAGKVEGVKHAVRPSQPKDHTDETLKHKIQSEVLRHFPAHTVNVNVEYGVAVLRGELQRPEQINALCDAVSRLDGIVEVRSFLHLPNTAPTNRY